MNSNKYDYSALCDVCGFKMKASELRKRWDGFMVCQEDWEPRNILDFYRTRNDAHLLPFTRPDDSGEKTWTASFANILGNYTYYASYVVDDNGVVTYKIVITPINTVSAILTPTVSLPFSVSTDKGGTALASNGVNFGQITATSSVATFPKFSITANPLVTLVLTGSFIKA